MKELIAYLVSAPEEKGIEYMLSGSVALTGYGLLRYTRDIELVVRLKEEQVDNFISIFPQEQFYLDINTVKEEVQRKGMFNAIYNPISLKIDFVVKKNTPYREEEFKRIEKSYKF